MLMLTNAWPMQGHKQGALLTSSLLLRAYKTHHLITLYSQLNHLFLAEFYSDPNQTNSNIMQTNNQTDIEFYTKL